jgi:hypothetical protein
MELNRADLSALTVAFKTDGERDVDTEGKGNGKNPPTIAPAELLNVPALPKQAINSPSTRPNQTSALRVLPREVLLYLSEFLADEPLALARLAATCSDMRQALDPSVQRYTWGDRSNKADSLERYQTLLKYGSTGGELHTSTGKLPPFRAELLATLGRRILALPVEDRPKAYEAFMEAVRQHSGPTTPALDEAVRAAENGIAHLQAVEKATIDGSMQACRRCGNLKELRALAARCGVCSPEGIAEMKFAAACGQVSRGATWEAARGLFGIAFDKHQEQREYEYDIALNWRDRLWPEERFYE